MDREEQERFLHIVYLLFILGIGVLFWILARMLTDYTLFPFMFA